MTRDTINHLIVKSCNLTAHLIALRAKLDAEAGREPTEREATEVAEQVDEVRRASQPGAIRIGLD